MASNSNRHQVGAGRAPVHMSKTMVETGQQRRSQATATHSMYKPQLPPSLDPTSQLELATYSPSDGSAGAIPKQRLNQLYNPANYTSTQSCTDGSKSVTETEKEREYDGTISMKIKYFDDIKDWDYTEKFKQKASVEEFMRWKYFINSPVQICECNKTVCRDLSGIIVKRNVLMVKYPYQGHKTLIHIAKDVVNYAVNGLVEMLSVETVIPNEQSTRKINKLFCPELAYAEEIAGKVYLVFPSSLRKDIEKVAVGCFCFNTVQNTTNFKGIVEELEPRFVHFETEITEKLIENYPAITVEFQKSPSHLLCILKSKSQNVNEAVALLRSFEIKCKEVIFSKTIVHALKTFSVENLINQSLKEKYPCCKAVQEQLLMLFALNGSDKYLDEATFYTSNLITEKEITLNGQYVRENSQVLAERIQNLYKNLVIVTQDYKGTRLTVVGLKDVVEGIKTPLLEKMLSESEKLDKGGEKFIVQSQAIGLKETSLETESTSRTTKHTTENTDRVDNDTQILNIKKSSSSDVANFKGKSAEQNGNMMEKSSVETAQYQNDNLPLPFLTPNKLKKEENDTDQGVKTTWNENETKPQGPEHEHNNTTRQADKTDHKMLEEVMKSNNTCQQETKLAPPNENASLHQHTTEKISLKNTKHSYLKTFPDLKKFSETFQVHLAFKSDPKEIEIQGSYDNVRDAVMRLEKYLGKLVSDSVDIPQFHVLQYCNSTEGEESLNREAENNRVLIKKRTTTTWNYGSIQISESERKNKFVWSSATKKLLILSHSELDFTTAPLKFKLEQVDTRINSRFKEEENGLVNIGIDVRTSGNEYECSYVLADIFWETLMKIAESKQDSSAFQMTAVANWKFDDIARCTVDVFVKWLLMTQHENHNKIIILVNDEGELRRSRVLITKAIEHTIKSKCHVDRLHPVIIKGQLDQTQVDVLVNTTDNNLTHVYGNVSSAIAKAAGKSLQQECLKNYPNGIKYDEIAVTGGHKLNCKNIFHISLRRYEPTTQIECFQGVEHLMRYCLKQASDMGHTSIAFPAIGTGNLQYPKDMVISQMFTSVERFKGTMWETSLEKVLFVIYPKDKDLFEDFTRIEREVFANQTATPTPFGKESLMTITITGEQHGVSQMKEFINKLETGLAKEEETKPKGEATKRSPKAKDRCQVKDTTKVKQIGEFRIQNVLVTIWKDSILNAQVDCIVNAADKDLNHREGISALIAKAAGKTMLQECKERIDENRGSFQATSIVVTAAGNLHFKQILHSVGPFCESYRPFTTASLKQCKKDVNDTIRRCLNYANEYECTSIAFSSFSSGIFAIPAEICAEQYAEALLDFEGTKSSVREVSFWDTDNEVLGVIHKTFSAMISERGKSPWTDSCFLENDGQSVENATTSYTHNKSKNVVTNTARSRPQSKIQSMDRKRPNICPAYLPNGRRLTVSFGPVHVVEIFPGDIFKCAEMDCFVCQIGENGEPVGKIAQTLQKLGGKDYITEKSKLLKTFDIGDVIITKGGHSRFGWIIHTVVSRSSKDVSLMYRNIFKAICDEGFVSVALPLLGADESKEHGPEKVTEILFQEWLECCRYDRKDELRLHLVVREDLAQIAQDVFKRNVDDLKKILSQTQENSQGHSGTGKHDTDSQRQDASGKDARNSNSCSEEQMIKGALSGTKENQEEICVICMDGVTDAKLLKCGHKFCKNCIDGYFRVKQVCPTCGKVCGIICGDQPDGTMHVKKMLFALSGFKGKSTISITYQFQAGLQGPDHPHPGTPYKGISRTAYLPDNREGREICAMLAVAFDRRLVFTIGESRTTGKEGVITWNDIHHKTDPRPNTQFGYPDDTYLQRVREELEVKGVLKDDVNKKLVKDLKKNDFSHTFQTDSTIN